MRGVVPREIGGERDADLDPDPADRKRDPDPDPDRDRDRKRDPDPDPDRDRDRDRDPDRDPDRDRDRDAGPDPRSARYRSCGGMMSIARLLPALGVLASALAAAPVFDARIAHADAAACDSYEVEYTLAANLQLTDTFMGAGNGVFPTGPGRVVLRWSHPAPDRVAVEMVSYELRQPFTMSTHALVWSATLASDTTARGTQDGRGVVATGAFQGRTIRWDRPVNGYHVDGTLHCDGSLCGKFGAPPAGSSDVHIPPGPIAFKPFELSPDGKTFSMDYVVVSRADSPKQTTLVALAGREVRRTCMGAKEPSSGP